MAQYPEDVFCVFEVVDDPINCVDLPHNRPFRVLYVPPPGKKRSSRDGTPGVDRSSQQFALTLNPASAKLPQFGFSFGSDPAKCDFLLDHPDKAFGVSGVHFRLAPAAWDKYRIIIQNCSKNGIEVGGDLLEHHGERLSMPRSASTTIIAGAVKINITFREGCGFRTKWAQWIQEVYARPANLQNISLQHVAVDTPVLQRHGETRTIRIRVAWNSGEGYDMIDGIRYGSACRVFKSQRHSDGALFDAKVTRDNAAARNEMHALDELTHRNIVRLHDHGRSENNLHFLILESALFGTLRTLLRDRAVIDPHVIVVQLLEALTFMHGKNWVHRNIRPENVLVFKDEPVLIKLGGFSHASKTEASIASPFTAPEIYDTEDVKPADVYSVGVIYFELMTAMNTRHTVPSMADVQRLSDPEKDLISMMLDADPANRPSAAVCLEKLKVLVSREAKSFGELTGMLEQCNLSSGV